MKRIYSRWKVFTLGKAWMKSEWKGFTFLWKGFSKGKVFYFSLLFKKKWNENYFYQPSDIKSIFRILKVVTNFENATFFTLVYNINLSFNEYFDFHPNSGYILIFVQRLYYNNDHLLFYLTGIIDVPHGNMFK